MNASAMTVLAAVGVLAVPEPGRRTGMCERRPAIHVPDLSRQRIARAQAKREQRRRRNLAAMHRARR